MNAELLLPRAILMVYQSDCAGLLYKGLLEKKEKSGLVAYK